MNGKFILDVSGKFIFENVSSKFGFYHFLPKLMKKCFSIQIYFEMRHSQVRPGNIMSQQGVPDMGFCVQNIDENSFSRWNPTSWSYPYVWVPHALGLLLPTLLLVTSIQEHFFKLLIMVIWKFKHKIKI